MCGIVLKCSIIPWNATPLTYKNHSLYHHLFGLTWWCHKIETFYWPFVRGSHRSPMNKGQWRRALMVSLNNAWTNNWANNADAGDLRHHRAHYDVIEMNTRKSQWFWSLSRGSNKSLATLTLGSSKINQNCWRFHGSGVIAAPQIIGLISFCTGMHHEYFFEVVNVLSCSPFMFENKQLIDG